MCVQMGVHLIYQNSKTMTTIKLINYIASHPEFKTIVLGDSDDRTPMQAIEILSSEVFENDWRINGTLEKNILLCYDNR